MSDAVRDAYDSMADRYVAVALGDLDRETGDRARLAAFAVLAAKHPGVVADLGCGPGHIVHHLSELGLRVVGYDISTELLARARRRYPDSRFELGDLVALDVDDATFGGIVARYSLIHTPPGELGRIFGEWRRVLEPGAPLLVSCFAAPSAEAHGTPFDHAVTTAYALFPATVEDLLHDAGFVDTVVERRGPLDDERRLDHGTILARRGAA